VGEDGPVPSEGQNIVDTERDVTGHAETNLPRKAYLLYDPETIAASTSYPSGEPCATCAGTVFWSGVGRMVYEEASVRRICELSRDSRRSPALRLSRREVPAAGTRATEVVGPILEEVAERDFEGSAG
jgi:tRNA(Arg) A34 adenosine deaminase TadA